MKRIHVAILAVMLSGSALAALPAPTRIRGTIAAVSASEITVHTTAGADVQVALGANTKYLQVVKADLANIEPGSYIGTATKSTGANQIALEVVVFPPAMKGVGEGHYAWDTIPDTTLSGAGTTSSSMTNGSVTAVAAPSSTTVKSAMTNGSVSAATDQGGVKRLTVSYKGGEQVVLVPPTAPIVTFHPATTADLTKGAAVFINAATDQNKTTAGVVAIGKDGLKPPM